LADPVSQALFGQQTLQPYRPSMRDRIADALSDFSGRLGAGRYTQQDVGRFARGAMDFVPFLGDAVAADDARQSWRQGDVVGAGVNALAAALGVVPVVGDVAGKAVRRARGAFEMDYFGTPVRILQNPTPREAAGFMNRTKYKAARRIQDPRTGDVYIWDANDPALHEMMAEKLGIEGPISDMIGID